MKTEELHDHTDIVAFIVPNLNWLTSLFHESLHVLQCQSNNICKCKSVVLQPLLKTSCIVVRLVKDQ